MNKRIYKSIHEIKETWIKTYSKSKVLSIFQSYEWNETLESSFKAHRFSKYYRCELEYWVYDDEIIFPLVNAKAKKSYTLLGQLESSDYLSPIFCERDVEKLHDALLDLIRCMAGFYLKLDRINQSNPFKNTIENLYASNDIIYDKQIRECVCVDTRTNTETYVESLSKSTKQNYRTAINRIHKANMKYSVEIRVGTISDELVSTLYSIYCERRDDCDSRSAFLKTASNTAKKLLSQCGLEKGVDPLSEYSKKKSVFLGYILIESEIAAFCEGGICNETNALCIARVATKGKYYQFSPGQILLNQVIDRIRKEIVYFDLTRGIEEYKFKLGGKVHNNYCYENLRLGE